MRLLALSLMGFLAVGTAGPRPVASASIAADELPPIRLPIVFTMEPQQRTTVPPSGQGGYYRPVQPQTYHRACGTVATDVCEIQVRVPSGATGEQVYQMGKQADAAGRKGEALGYLHRSAEMGYVMAEGAYGMALLTGKGAMRDAQNGVAWLEKSAAQGNRGAQVELGMAFEDGDLVRGDQAKAIQYLSAAAQQHQSVAEHRLGLDYETGNGVPHNRALAIQWLRRAAADGAPAAGATATALSKAGSRQFHSVDEIDAYMAPPAAPVKAGSCPHLNVSSTGPNMQGAIYVFCQCHPGCSYSSPGFPNMSCSNAGARPYCNGSY